MPKGIHQEQDLIQREILMTNLLLVIRSDLRNIEQSWLCMQSFTLV